MKIEHCIINQLEEWLHSHSSNIDQIYISFGAKYNEKHVYLRAQNNGSNYHTNSIYQMIPHFIRYPQTDKHNIIIVIDEFYNKQLLEKNKNLLINEMKIHCLEGLTVLLVDHKIHPKKIDEILDPILHFSQSFAINPQQLKIVNYIQFQHPNDLEFELEKELPKSIVRFLKNRHEGNYINSYYQWYGYKFYYYNYIYQYQDYHFTKLMYMMFIQNRLLEKSIDSTQLNTLHYEKIDVLAKLLKHESEGLYQAWICFKKNNIHLKDDFICSHSQDND
jgi:hypothetical protein